MWVQPLVILNIFERKTEVNVYRPSYFFPITPIDVLGESLMALGVLITFMGIQQRTPIYMMKGLMSIYGWDEPRLDR